MHGAGRVVSHISLPLLLGHSSAPSGQHRYVVADRDHFYSTFHVKRWQSQSLYNRGVKQLTSATQVMYIKNCLVRWSHCYASLGIFIDSRRPELLFQFHITTPMCGDSWLTTFLRYGIEKGKFHPINRNAKADNTEPSLNQWIRDPHNMRCYNMILSSRNWSNMTR